MRVGIIGVGTMGAPIARVLGEIDRIVVYDRDPKRLTHASRFARTVGSPAAVAASADVVITVLPGPRETEDAFLAIGDELSEGSCWLDLSTGDPRATRRLSEALGARGIGSVAAPMAGGPAAADTRELHFTVAGRTPSVERVRSLLDALSAPGGVEVIGEEPADAQTVKLLSNLLWFGQVIAVTEAMLLGRAAGLDPGRLRQLLASRSGSSVLLERDFDAVLEGDYMPAFGIDRVTEQLATLSSLARDLSVPFELSSLVERTHREALTAFGPVDGELLAARLLEERSGATFATR